MTQTKQLITHEKPAHGSLDWLMKRHRDADGRCLLGASDAPALMNASQFTSRADLFVNKKTTPQITESNAAMHFGNIVEPVLVEELGRRLNLQMITPKLMFQRDRFIVSLDAMNYASDNVIGEVKTTRRYRIQTLDDVPKEYLWQCWAQMYVTDAQVFLIVLDRDMNVTHHEIPRNEEAMELLASEAEKFCTAVDLADEKLLSSLVDDMTADQIAALYRPQPIERELTSEQVEWIRELEDARDLKKQAEQLEKAAKDQIARFMLDAEIATYNGTKVLSWKEQSGRESLDVARLRAEHPDLCASFMKQGEPIRVMRISNTKGK